MLNIAPPSMAAVKVPGAITTSKPAELNLNSLSLSKEEVKLFQNASQKDMTSIEQQSDNWYYGPHLSLICI